MTGPLLPTAGPIAPSPDGVDRVYWEGLLDGQLRLPRCRGCGRHVWTPQWMCPRCHGTDFDWPTLRAADQVYSWTRTWHAFVPELADTVPYVVVLVRLDDAPEVRLLGMLTGDASDPRIGATVTGVTQPPSPLTSDLPVLRWELS
jgi:uncharacterized OB-fold protein